MNKEQFLEFKLITNLKYFIFINNLVQYDSNELCKDGICLKCNENKKLSISHSISKAWNHKKPNNNENFIIYSLDFDPSLSKGKEHPVFRNKKLFFSNQKKDGDQYTNNYHIEIEQYMNFSYNLGLWENSFSKSLENYQYYIHSGFSLMCNECDKKYQPIDDISFLKNFEKEDNEKLYPILIERFYYYYMHERNYVKDSFKYNLDILNENIKTFESVYFQNNLALNIPLFINQAQKKLLELKNDIINSYNKDKHRHSFISIFLELEIHKPYFYLMLGNDNIYEKTMMYFLDIIDNYLINQNLLHSIYSNLDISVIKNIHTNMIEHKNNIKSYLDNPEISNIPKEFSSLNSKVINLEPILFYGFCYFDLYLFNIFLKYDCFKKDEFICLFISPKFDNINKISAYFCESTTMNIIDDVIKNISKEIEEEPLEVEKIFFLYSFILAKNDLTLYSLDKNTIDNMINIKKTLDKIEYKDKDTKEIFITIRDIIKTIYKN